MRCIVQQGGHSVFISSRNRLRRKSDPVRLNEMYSPAGRCSSQAEIDCDASPTPWDWIKYIVQRVGHSVFILLRVSIKSNIFLLLFGCFLLMFFSRCSSNLASDFCSSYLASSPLIHFNVNNLYILLMFLFVFFFGSWKLFCGICFKNDVILS